MARRGVVAGVLSRSCSWVAVELPMLAEAWEVDNATGGVVYLGRDLTLACELYGDDPAGHLVPVAAVPAGTAVAS